MVPVRNCPCPMIKMGEKQILNEIFQKPSTDHLSINFFYTYRGLLINMIKYLDI